jgi:ABC-2 type transport system permease protein
VSLTQIIGIAQRIGIQIVRSKWTIPYLILFPLFFIGLYWFGFSASPVGITQTFSIGIINQDAGLSDDIVELFSNETIVGDSFSSFHSSTVLERGFAAEFVAILGNITYVNETDAPYIFKISLLNNSKEADKSLYSRDLDLVMILSPQFSRASVSMLNAYWNNTYGYFLHELIQSEFPETPDLPVNINETVQIKGDSNFINFKQANSIIHSIIFDYQEIAKFFSGPGGSITLEMDDEYLVSIPEYSLFDLSLPGLIAFGIIIQPSLTSMFVCMEFRDKNKTFDRIHLSSISPTVYLFGSILIQIPVMIVQSAILFISSVLMGFNPAGDLFLGFLISLTIFPFCLFLLYITTAFFSNEDVVGSILGFGAPFCAFMSGAFIDIPKFVLIPKIFPTASGFPRDFLLWDLLPLTHTVNALRQVILFDFSFIQIIPDLTMSLILSLIYFGISVLIFAYFRFKRV